MKQILLTSLLLCGAALTGCVTPQRPIHLDAGYWSHKPDSVGVVVVKMPKPGTMKAGAQGLLDIAINDAMANPLTKHLNALSLEDFRESGKVISAHFAKQGVPTRFIPEELDVSTLPKVKNKVPDYAALDYTALKARYGVDQLIVLEVSAAGTIRSYYGFIPTGAPQGYFSCRGSLIDLNTNKLLWTASAVQQVPIDDPWDQEADGYPHVTSAFYRALETAKTSMVSDLVGSTPAKVSSTR